MWSNESLESAIKSQFSLQTIVAVRLLLVKSAISPKASPASRILNSVKSE